MEGDSRCDSVEITGSMNLICPNFKEVEIHTYDKENE